MFTGIVEEVGKVLGIKKGSKSSVLVIEGKLVCDRLMIGDSIAVNGVCLTVTSFTRNSFTADIMSESLQRSSLGSLQQGSPVNLERAMIANGRFGGHIVTGHIDGTGTITRIQKDDNAVWYTIATPPKLMRYIVEKGSVAIDGVSLTVANLEADSFQVSIIPHTARATILSTKKAGDLVNLENDIVGKYIERFLESPPKEEQPKGGITREFLIKAGY